MKSDYEQWKLFELIKKGSFSKKGCFEWNGCCDKDGYGYTTFSPFGKKIQYKVHRLIYVLLIGEIPANMFICHSCDNPKCFNINHLFLGTPKDNSSDRDRKKHGSLQNQKGQQNHSAILNEKIIFAIRKMYQQGIRICAISRELEIRQETISKIVHRKRWTHI